jgi:hypothetical protein
VKGFLVGGFARPAFRDHDRHHDVFAGWVAAFAGEEKLTTALLDRLAHDATPSRGRATG